MLSKSKGQILRVAASLHVLFALGYSEDTCMISENAIAASIKFVELCCQQTAYMAGRGNMKEEIEIVKASRYLKQEIPWCNYGESYCCRHQ